MEQTIYRDITERTGGDIYIGVVGPVRTGKSTFIKRFMETQVIPNIENVYRRERAIDELPQSASGRTVMTAEPKFVPEEAVEITMEDGASFSVRLVDCVGYMVPGALGQTEENGEARMVTTPWFDREIPMREAAEIGTRKVIGEHSTIGIVVTTDGTVGDLPREDYVEAEERVISELKALDKPFAVLLNTHDPDSRGARELAREISEKHGAVCMPVNCLMLQSEDVKEILKTVLYEFPVREMDVFLPPWVEALGDEQGLKKQLYDAIRCGCGELKSLRHAKKALEAMRECGAVEEARMGEILPGKGKISVDLTVPRHLFYETLSEESGLTVADDGDLLLLLKDLSAVKKEHSKVEKALRDVRETGYGIVMPEMEELVLEEPEIIRQGGRYGVSLKASAPSIHMLRADIKTSVSPIVGSEKQSEEMVDYLLREFEDDPIQIWQSNMFGRSFSQMVGEDLQNKLRRMPADARDKLRETLQRIINEGSGGLICIIL